MGAEAYGVPPEQIMGSSIQKKFQLVDRRLMLLRLPQVDFIDDREGKPVAIRRVIGRRHMDCRPTRTGVVRRRCGPGDRPMLEYAAWVRRGEFDRVLPRVLDLATEVPLGPDDPLRGEVEPESRELQEFYSLLCTRTRANQSRLLS